MKKLLLMFIAFFAMTVAAHATDYTGNVTDVQMGSKTPTVDQTIIFSVEDTELTGNFSITSMFPHHDINLAATISGTTFPASGTAKVFGITQKFNGTIMLTTLNDSTLVFTFVGQTTTGTNVKFTFKGTAE